jgi:hypothetical protein
MAAADHVHVRVEQGDQDHHGHHSHHHQHSLQEKSHLDTNARSWKLKVVSHEVFTFLRVVYNIKAPVFLSRV